MNRTASLALALLLAAPLLTACPSRREPPPLPEGTVIQVRPLVSRPRTVYVVVQYPSGRQGEYRLTRGDCVVGDRYPSCVNDPADR